MKQIYIFLLLLLYTINVLAQSANDYITNLSAPSGILIIGDELYYLERTAGKLSKVDLTQATPNPVEIINGLNNPEGMFLLNNELYIANSGAGNIIKINITITSPAITNVVTGLNYPTSLVIVNNDIYIAEFGGNKISKGNILSIPTTATEIITGLSQPYQLKLNNNELYLSQRTSNKISKIDITSPTPSITDILTELITPEGMFFYQNEIYFCQFDSNTVIKTDLSNDPTYTLNLVIDTNISQPRGIAFHGTYIYISNNNGGKISKYNESTLSVDDNATNNLIQLFPNPSNNFIKISGLTTKENYKIFNVFGVEVKNGIIDNQEKIDIRSFKTGLYFVKFENRNTIKFLKE